MKNKNRYILKPIKFNTQMAYTKKQLEDMELEYFTNNNSNTLSKDMYNVCSYEDIIDKYVYC